MSQIQPMETSSLIMFRVLLESMLVEVYEVEAGVRRRHRNQIQYYPTVLGLRRSQYNFADLFLCQ